jgi:hypothetical protein
MPCCCSTKSRRRIPSIQHPAAGDGPRHADRQQRAQGRLPQCRDRHDHQCRAEALQKTSIGFTTNKGQGDEMADIKRMFTPEFRNRLDAIISFRALDAEIILRVVDKFLMQLEGQLHEKKVEAIFTDMLRAWLAEKGFDPLMGARPMARLIQDTIRSALADELLFGTAGPWRPRHDRPRRPREDQARLR